MFSVAVPVTASSLPNAINVSKCPKSKTATFFGFLGTSMEPRASSMVTVASDSAVAVVESAASTAPSWAPQAARVKIEAKLKIVFCHFFIFHSHLCQIAW